MLMLLLLAMAALLWPTALPLARPP